MSQTLRLTTFDIEQALEEMAAAAKQIIGPQASGVAAIALHPKDRVRDPRHVRAQTRVVESIISPANPNVVGDQDANCLSIALGKISQMMRTGQPSGRRLAILGEPPYQGGLIGLRGDMVIFVAFSGGNEDQDLEIARMCLKLLGCMEVDSLD